MLAGKSLYQKSNPDIKCYKHIELFGKTPDYLALDPHCYLSGILAKPNHGSFCDDATRASVLSINTENLKEHNKKDRWNDFWNTLTPEQKMTISRINVFIGIADDFSSQHFYAFAKTYLNIQILQIKSIVKVKIIHAGCGLFYCPPGHDKKVITTAKPSAETDPDVIYTTELLIFASGLYTIYSHEIALFNPKLTKFISFLR